MEEKTKGLKSCPFCGGKAKVFMEHDRAIGLTLWCQCQNCHAKTIGYCPKDDLESFKQCKELAINEWNRRTGEENQDFMEALSMDCPYCDYVHDCTENCEECEIYDDYLDDINDLYQDFGGLKWNIDPELLREP